MMITVERILVPTDFSETSDAALKYAFGLAQTFSAQLYLLHVPGKTGENFEADFPIDQFEKVARERLETLVIQQEARELRPEYAMRIGTPFRTSSTIADCGQSATSQVNSSPRMIGPGCISIASFFASFSRAMVIW